MAEVLRTQCCIAGGGPAGAMLGLLLARRGLDVVVLEKHADFLRDFRGDTIHPSTMEVLDELGLADAFLALNPNRVSHLTGNTPAGRITVADFRDLRSRYPFVALIPQWDFLAFLTRQASRCSGFHLLMRAEATDLVEEDGVVRGLRYESPDGAGEIRATLTVAADGRSSVLRRRAGLPVREASQPIDVLWFRLPRVASDPEDTAGYLGGGHIVALINRRDYWQIAYVIPKGSAERLRAAGIEELRAALRRLVPELGDRIDLLTGWDQVSVLSVQANRLRRWHRPGLLCIGDAAHAMSPVGGVGINFAIQDAVAAANVLTEPIRRGHVTPRDLAAVQRQRSWQVRTMQLLQAIALRAALAASRAARPGPVSTVVRRVGGALFSARPALALRSRLVGLGLRRVHVAT
ncbi:MAG TPA: FAD-dependent oxidoreductase [Candidatus Dormibacteraeota bacterium]|nr:FAD-dependent oxidoreductase [Candidatus Dormibacteraeota bacterium]